VAKVKVWDKLMNMVTGAGGASDKTLGNYFATPVLDNATLLNMYRSDWISRKIIDLPPFDMCREGREWQADVDTEIGPLEELEAELNVWQKICIAMQWARLYGDAILYMGIKGQNPASELKPDSIGVGSLQYLHVMAGGATGEYTVNEIERDPISERYGEPKYYELPAGDQGKAPVRIHPSRVVHFYGNRIPGNRQAQIWNRGESVLVSVLDAVDAALTSSSIVTALLQEAKTDVVHVPNLSDYLATSEGTSKITARFQGAKAVKSIYNVLLLEGDGTTGENWEQKQVSFGGLTEILNHYLQVVAGAADIPATRMIGQSPKGMNATGDSDIRNYYDHIKARQNFELRPAIRTLDEVLIRSALGSRPDTIYFEFGPLWQLSDKEKADAAFVKAQATNLYATNALIPTVVLEHALKNQLIEDGTYPGIEKAYADFEQQALEPLDPEAAAIEAEQQALALEQQRKITAAPIAPPPGPPKAKGPPVPAK
jgi:phage-related protein (TIGR01555 family)